MRLFLDKNNVIIGYELTGASIDGIEYDPSDLPDDFLDKYKSTFYMIKNGNMIENPNYEKPEPPVVGPSNFEKQMAALSYQQMIDSQTIETLQSQNAQMAYQIMTGGNA